MRTALKWAGIVVGSLALLVIVVGFVASRVGAATIAEVHDVPVASLTIPSDSASVARGAHLSGIYGCQDCHGVDLAGQVMSEEGPFRLVAPNLTPAGIGSQYGPEDWDRAIRHGVGVDGTALFVMPSGAYHEISDTEAADLIAYLETVPPVEKDLPPMEYRFMGKVLAAGPLGIDKGVHPEPSPTTSPAPGATVEYGAYVAGMMCAYCHGTDLAGKPADQPGAPDAPGLASSGQWPAETFHEVLTTGVLPSGREMNPEFMPWTSTARMTPDEREGLRRYLATLTSSGDA